MPRRTTKIKGGLLEHVLKDKSSAEVQKIMELYKNYKYNLLPYKHKPDNISNIPYFAYFDKYGTMHTSKENLDEGKISSTIFKPSTIFKHRTDIKNESIANTTKNDVDLIRVVGPVINILKSPGMTTQELENKVESIKNTVTRIKKDTMGLKSNSLLEREFKKKGGGIKKESERNENLLNQLSIYCAYNSVDDEKDLKKYYENINENKKHETILESKDTYDVEKFNLLIDYIGRNKTSPNLEPVIKRLYINCNKFYRYEDCMPYYDYNKVLIKDIKCFKYNDDIITSFENVLVGDDDVDYSEGVLENNDIFQKFTENIYSNNKVINDFLKEQLEFLEKLPLHKKRILQDYTRINTTFHFYDLHRWGKIDEFNTFRYFSDGFYTQIYKLYNDEYSKELNHIYFESFYSTHPDNKNKKDDDWFQDWLQCKRVPDKKEEYGVVPKEYKHAEETIFDVATFINWELVLLEFLQDVSLIILEAPIVKETIHGFRGVSSHYIRESEFDEKSNKYISAIRETLEDDKKKSGLYMEDTTLTSLNYFVNNRISSMTFNFDVSKSFHDKYIGKTSSVYKASIQPGCRALLIAPLSMFYHEFEILTPQYTTFGYIPESIDESVSELTTNNIKKQYGICIKKEFKVYSNLAIKTPQNLYDLQEQFKIYQIRQKAKKDREHFLTDTGDRIANDIAAKMLNKLQTKHYDSTNREPTKIIQDDVLIKLYTLEATQSGRRRTLDDADLVQLAKNEIEIIKAEHENQNIVNEVVHNIWSMFGNIFPNNNGLPEAELPTVSDEPDRKETAKPRAESMMLFIDGEFKLVNIKEVKGTLPEKTFIAL